MNKFKDLSLIFMVGVIAVLYVLIDLISYVLIEKKLLLYSIGLIVTVFLAKYLAHVLIG